MFCPKLKLSLLVLIQLTSFWISSRFYGPVSHGDTLHFKYSSHFNIINLLFLLLYVKKYCDFKITHAEVSCRPGWLPTSPISETANGYSVEFCLSLIYLKHFSSLQPFLFYFTNTSPKSEVHMWSPLYLVNRVQHTLHRVSK